MIPYLQSYSILQIMSWIKNESCLVLVSLLLVCMVEMSSGQRLHFVEESCTRSNEILILRKELAALSQVVKDQAIKIEVMEEALTSVKQKCCHSPVSAVEISLDSPYVSGSNSSINCTVTLGDMTDTDVKLEGCQGGTYVDLEETGIAVRDTLFLNDDQGVNCTTQIIYRYHITFRDILNNMLVRCYSKDNLYNRSISTTCVSVNVKQAQATMKPTLLYGEWGSKATFECRIPLLEMYFSAFQFQFHNDSTSPLLSITAENKFTIPPQNERISAIYTSAPIDNYRAVNITFDLRPGDNLCNLIGPYLCRVKTFNESLIAPIDDEGQLIIAAPPSNVSTEIEPLYVNGAINQTINCTAIININTTELSLQYNINGNYITAQQNITQTIIESEMTDDCRHRVRVINVFSPSLDLDGYKVVCIASDTVFGKESRSKEETLSIFSIS